MAKLRAPRIKSKLDEASDVADSYRVRAYNIRKAMSDLCAEIAGFGNTYADITDTLATAGTGDVEKYQKALWPLILADLVPLRARAEACRDFMNADVTEF